MTTARISHKVLLGLVAASWILQSICAFDAAKVQEMVGSFASQNVIYHMVWFLALAGSYLTLATTFLKLASKGKWPKDTFLSGKVAKHQRFLVLIPAIEILVGCFLYLPILLHPSWPAIGRALLPLISMPLVIVLAGSKTREILRSSADRKYFATILIFSILAAGAIYCLMRTFLYLSVFQCSLWLTPDRSGNETVVWIPTWLDQRIPRSSYNEINKSLLELVPFGHPVNKTNGLWVPKNLSSAFHYFRWVTLAALPSTHLPLPVEWVELTFSGTFNPISWILPSILGHSAALLTFLLMKPALTEKVGQQAKLLPNSMLEFVSSNFQIGQHEHRLRGRPQHCESGVRSVQGPHPVAPSAPSSSPPPAGELPS